jgi:hypothetical protein
MKKLFLLSIAFAAITISASAQTEVAAQQVKLSKEEKAKIKAKQDEDLKMALVETGLTEDQIRQVKETLDAASKKSTELKNNTSLSEDAKADEKKKINDEKNCRLKEIMGKEKYHQWNEIRKKQKEKNSSQGAGQ